MPRPLRIQVEGAASYIHQEALAGIDLFKAEEDYAAYARLLKEYQTKYQFNVFSYALTPKKVHLLVEPAGDVSTSQFMRDLTSRYSKYYNGCYAHSGSLFHGRFKTVLVEMGEALEEVKGYLASLTADAANANTAGATYSYEGLREALKGTAYGSPEFIEFVKQSAKTGHAAEAVLKPAVVQSSAAMTATVATATKAVKVMTATKIVPVFSLGFAALAGVLVVSAVVGTNFWVTRPAAMEKHAVKAEAVRVKAETKTEVVPQAVVTAARAIEKKLVIVLDGTEWNVQLIPMEGASAQDRKVEFDQLKFMSNRVASQKFATNGYNAAHYTVSQTPEGVIVWETIQRNASGEMVSWRGEWVGDKMSGVLSKQLTDGKAQVFNFIGTMMDGTTGAASAAPKML